MSTSERDVKKECLELAIRIIEAKGARELTAIPQITEEAIEAAKQLKKFIDS